MIPQIPLPFPAPHLAFEAFCAGSGQPLVDQLRRVALGEEERCIFLWGAPGTGKSHLLQAACLEADRHGRRAAYLPLADRGQLRPEVLEGLEALNLVCVDDLDTVCGIEEWEHGLFHLFNRMRDARRSLLLAAHAAPAALPVALPDLASRLSWDLVFHVEALDEAGRFAALSHRARLLGMEIPEEVLTWLARRVPRDQRTLFALLERLDRASLAAKRKLTVPFVRELIERS